MERGCGPSAQRVLLLELAMHHVQRGLWISLRAEGGPAAVLAASAALVCRLEGQKAVVH